MKVISVFFICIVMCFALTGCENKNEVITNTENKVVNENNNNDVKDTENKKDNKESENKAENKTKKDDEKNVAKNTTKEEAKTKNEKKEKTKDEKIADNWMSMPENINLVWKSEERSNPSNYEISQDYKRGNNIMHYVYRVDNGNTIRPGYNGIANEYYYYHHQGDYKWTSYVYYHDLNWDYWYFIGNYPASPQDFCLGRPWEILDKYSNEHETVEIEGVGKVDTVKGTSDEGYTYYYSKVLNMNVKYENKAQIWSLQKFDTKPSTGYPHDLPDMKALDAKRAEDDKKAEEKRNNTTENTTEDESPDVYEDENGELVIMED